LFFYGSIAQPGSAPDS